MERGGPRSLWPYTERNGIAFSEQTVNLFEGPEILLSEEEKKVVKEFADGLFEGNLGDKLICESARNLETLYKTSALEGVQKFYLDFFETEQGQQALIQLGMEGAAKDEVRTALHNINLINSRVGAKSRKQIASDSSNWRKAEMAGLLQNSPELDEDYEDMECVKINYNPAKFLDKLSDLQAYRRFYKEAHSELKKEPASNLRSAKEVLLDIHVARVNSMVVELYPAAINLGEQLANSKTNIDGPEWASRLKELMPILHRALARERDNYEDDFKVYTDRLARRLDFVRNGAAWQGHSLSPVSSELYQLSYELEQEQSREIVASSEALFNSETTEELSEINWRADQIKDFFDKVLAEWQKLSEYSSSWEEIEEREGFARDGKWQVAPHPRKKHISIDGSKRVVWIAEKFDRSLTQELPAGVLPGVSHEAEHVLQSDFDYQLAQQIALAKIKGKRSSTLREAGAIYQERKIHEMLGTHRPTNLHYLRALEVKLAGGNRLETARAFFNSYSQGKNLDQPETEKARELAVDRSLRLFRHKGHNSKPLAYIEQELIMKEIMNLPLAKAEALMIAGSSFSLRDLARLHAANLIDLPSSISASPAEDVMRVFIRDYLPKIQHSKVRLEG